MIAQRIPVLSGGWRPNMLGDALRGAWDAERTDLITLSGSTVTSWLDTVAGYNAAQGVLASRPIYSATSFNGRPGLTFDGLDDEMTYAGVGLFPTGATAGELWALVDQTALVADTTARNILGYGGASFPTARNIRRVVVSGVNRARAVVGDGAATSNTTNLLSDFSGRQVIRAKVGASETLVNVSGTEDPTPTAVVPGTGSVRTRIGAATSGTAADFFQGVINYAAITTTLTSEQAAQMVQFLKSRGGIP